MSALIRSTMNLSNIETTDIYFTNNIHNSYKAIIIMSIIQMLIIILIIVYRIDR